MNLIYFNNDGSLKSQFTFSDPYRRGNHLDPIFNNDLAIHGFDEEGNIKEEILNEVKFIINQKEARANSLACQIYYANEFSSVKSAPPACYFWR